MAKRLTKEEIEKLDKSIDEELQRNPEMRRELEEMREGAAMHCAGELMDAKQFRLILKACDEDADMMKRVLDYFPKPLDIGTAILVMERFGMLIPQATTEDGTLTASEDVTVNGSLTVNDSGRRYVNGSMGIVKKLREESVDVLLEDGKLITVGATTKEITKPVVKEKKVKKLVKEPVLNDAGQPEVDSDGNVVMKDVLREVTEEEIVHEKVGTFSQLPVRVAYAITIHKSQGKTFSKINLDPYAWDDGQFYTALSRGKTLGNIFFLQTIRPSFIKTSTEVKRFMKEAEKASKGILEG